MAARINTRLILIVAVCLVTAGCVIGLLTFLQMRGDASRAVRIGDEFFAAGDMEKARDYYRSAVGREPGNREYIDKLERAILEYRPVSPEDADRWYFGWLSVLRHRSVHFPQNDEVQLAYLEALHAAARRSNALRYWNYLESQAGEMLDRLGDDSDLAPRLRLHEAFAGLRMGQDALTIEELRDLERQVDDAAATLPEDDRAWAMRLTSKAIFFRRLHQGDQTARADEKIAELRRLMDEASEAVPDGLDTLRAAIVCAEFVGMTDALTYRADFEAGQGERVDRFTGMLRAAQNAPAWLVLDGANVLASLPQFVEPEVALDILRSYLEAHPEALDLRLALANRLRTAGELEAASAEAERVLDSEPMTVGFVAVSQRDYKRQAASLMGDIEFVRWENAEPDGRAAHVEAMARIRERMADLVPDVTADPMIIRLEGQLAYARGEYDNAVSRFETLIQDFGVRDVQTYLIDARSLEQIDQLGSALQRIVDALAIQPDNRMLLVDRARLEYLTGRHEQARTTVGRILSADPDDEPARRLLALLDAAQQAGVEGATDQITVVLRSADRHINAGDFDAARTELREAMEIAPDDWRLHEKLVAVEVSAGNVETAQTLLERLLEQSPNEQRWLQIKSMLATETPVEAMTQYIGMTREDPKQRAVAMLSGLTSMITRQQLIRNEAERRGEDERAAAAEAVMNEAYDAADSAVVDLEAVDPNHEAIVEYRFTTALLNEDWEEAERLLQRARAENLDGVGGRVYQSRYEMAAGQYVDAVRTLREVTEQRHYSARHWYLLAVAAVRAGDTEEARRAYAEAYRCNPADLSIVRRYAALLNTVGDKTRARRVLRDAYNLAPGNAALREQWLALEEEVGVEADVLEFRLRRYAADPGDLVNTAALARLLGHARPTRLHLLDEQGEPLFTPLEWRQLTAVQQREVLDDTQDRWRAFSERLLQELEDGVTDPFDVALLRAEILQKRGEYDEAVALITDFFAAQTPESITLPMRLRYARFLNIVNRHDEAVAALQAGLSDQDPERLEVDAALAETYLLTGDRAAALPHLIKIVEATGELSRKIQLVESYVALGRFGDADAMVEAMIAANELDDYQEAMVRATVERGKARAAFERGDEEAGRAALRAAREALADAAEMREESPQPSLQLARHFLLEFELTGDDRALDSALGAADRAKDLDPASALADQLRAEINMARGDRTAAISALADVLRAEPANSRARHQLIQYRLQSGNAPEALRLAREAVDLRPNDAQWRAILGDLLLSVEGDADAALAQFGLAYEFTRDPVVLAQMLEVMLSTPPADPEGALELIGRQDEAERTYPAVMALHARALHGAGNIEDARELMTRAYRTYREMIAADQLPPASIGAWLANAETLFPAGRTDQLEAYVREVSDDDPGPHLLRQLANRTAMGGDTVAFEHAIELQQAAIDRCPEGDEGLEAALLSELAALCIRAERFEAAVEAYERVMALRPDDIVVLNNYAFLLAEHLDRPSEALTHARRANGMSPDHPDVLDTLGWVYFKLGQHREAADYLQLSLSTRESVSAYVHLARVLIAEDDLDGAAERLIRAERLNPNDETRREIDQLKDDIRQKRAQAATSASGE